MVRLPRRNPSNYVKVIWKSVIFVFLSYLGCWIDAESAPARVTLAVLMILIVMTKMESVESSMPNICYHVWLTDFQLGCLMFNVACFFIYVLVNFGVRQNRKLLRLLEEARAVPSVGASAQRADQTDGAAAAAAAAGHASKTPALPPLAAPVASLNTKPLASDAGAAAADLGDGISGVWNGGGNKASGVIQETSPRKVVCVA